MYKQNLTPLDRIANKMRKSVSSLVILLLAGIICQPSIALAISQTQASSEAKSEEPKDKPEKLSTIAEDFKLPVLANSKNQFLDGKTKTSIFVDNVVIRQGSLEILADRVEANATAGKGKEIITATGSPATYTQRLEDGTMVSASANEIIYTVESQTISLNGNAAIVQNDVKMNGNIIAFDMAKERIMASTQENSSDVVTTILSPGAFASESDNEDSDDEEDEDSPRI